LITKIVQNTNIYIYIYIYCLDKNIKLIFLDIF
jgi:hypothetical protein